MISTGPSVTRLAEFINGSAFRPEDLDGQEGLPVIRIRQLLDETAAIEYAKPPIKSVLIDDGDLIFSWSATLAVRHWNRGKALLNQHLFRVDTHLGIDKSWFGYVLTEGVERLKPLMHGSAMTHITKDMLRLLTVEVPPQKVQHAIAVYLDTETARIDALLSAKQRMIELFRIRTNALVECKMGNLREQCNEVPLKRLVREIDQRLGEHTPPEMLSVSIHHGVIRRSQVTDKLPRAEELSAYKMCNENDIVLNRMRAFQGGVGRSHQVGIVSPDYTVLRPCNLVLPQYLHYVFRSPWFIGEMTARLRGIGDSEQGNVRTPRINFAELGLIKVPLPSMTMQAHLVDKLDSKVAQIRTITEKLSYQIDLLREHRQAFITAVVTGELKIPTLEGVA